ncbi:MAG: ribose-phosphate pyrophosphokinase [Proteobacteria bacterium]|nr:ribose-phosphate pyrophosphokinase [Pseudomonadota bacterium]
MPVFVNRQPINTFNFPGGECYVRINPVEISGFTDVTAVLNDSDSLMSLLLAIDAIRRVNLHTQIRITIPYFPYARQDRVCNAGESLSVKVMADLINALQCYEVVIYDPHSDVTPALLNRCKVISSWEIIVKSCLREAIISNNWVLISPDAGAEKKVKAAAKSLSTESNQVEVHCASKIRDTLTGKILSTQINGDVRGKNLLIIDDICDGGQTFISLAQELKDHGAADMYLYVTHGIFSKGLEILKQHFKKIYCFHTLISQKLIDKEFLQILGAQEYEY